MVKGQIKERISKLKQNFKQPTGKVLQNADVYLTYIVDMFSFQQIKLQTIILSDVNIIIYYITQRLRLKNWDWIIAPPALQQETQPTVHVRCRLKTLSILMILL